MDKRVHVVVRGRVQNVGFRVFVLGRARQLGLRGWVRNLEDARRLEVEAEGETEQVDALIAVLGHGPAGARVEEVAVEQRTVAGTRERSFSIR